jgi:predicted CopG family antitoxin
MGTKTVALDEKSYESLSLLKKKDESFSDVVRRLTNTAKPLSSYAGVWKDMPSKLSDEIAETIKEARANDRKRLDSLIRKAGD